MIKYYWYYLHCLCGVSVSDFSCNSDHVLHVGRMITCMMQAAMQYQFVGLLLSALR